MPRVSDASLRSFAQALLITGGALPEEAAIVAESLVEANLRGYESHGVMRLPQYIDSVRSGEIRPGAKLSIAHETPAMLTCDGGWSFGQVLGRDLTSRLIDKAKVIGVGCGTLRQSSHVGRLGEYAEMAAEAGMVSFVLANTHGGAQRVAPVGGIRPRLGTNPLCMGCPGGKEGPFVLDFGTTVTAEGKVRVHKIAGKTVPDGWLLDCEGNPSNDPSCLYADPPGTILPMGGSQAYKGFGLAFLIELFCSGLSGAPVASEKPVGPKGNAAFFLIVSPEHAAGTSHLSDQTRLLEDYVRGVARRADVAEITLPGDPERRAVNERRKNGIEFDEGNWSALTTLATSLGVAAPDVAK